MAAYYHTQGSSSNNNNTTPSSTDIPDHSNLHTLILMNPNFEHQHHHQHGGYDPHHHTQQPPPSQHNPAVPSPTSNNIHLLNSAAAAAAFSHHPPPLPYQFVRLPAPEQNNITLYGYPQDEAREMSRARQGLSLSLNSQNPGHGGQEGGQHMEYGGGEGSISGGGGGQVSVLGSKYLRAAQELLEEVVHVGNSSTNDHHQSPKKGKGVSETASEEKEKLTPGGCGQMSTAERQEVLMKKAKLVAMLDEAEQRYRQYHNQMQIVIESFERAAGMGSAKTYTSLALKTISKQFRCLKDAIQGQIRAVNKSLGEEEGGSSAGKIEGSRLKFIDHQIRQQRALQQLGMIQNHNAWRPQRGLPERSVSVLRAWLFEHFLHPYPKDSDKIMLAKQTGLTRSQVSNWFINARVRLWKPMIEEMYNEELKEHELNASEEKTSTKENSNDDAGASNSTTDQEKINIADINAQFKVSKDQNNGENCSSSFISMPTNSALPYKGNHENMAQNQHGFTINGALELEGFSPGSPKRQRGNELLRSENNGEILIKFGDDQKHGRDSNDGYPIISGGMNFMGGGNQLESYSMADIGRFEAEEFPPPTRFLQGNGISLSLGLPPSVENHHHHQHFNNISTPSHTFMAPNQNLNHSAAAFECMDIQNRKGFAAQLLPDFVA